MDYDGFGHTIGMVLVWFWYGKSSPSSSSSSWRSLVLLVCRRPRTRVSSRLYSRALALVLRLGLEANLLEELAHASSAPFGAELGGQALLAELGCLESFL